MASTGTLFMIVRRNAFIMAVSVPLIKSFSSLPLSEIFFTSIVFSLSFCFFQKPAKTAKRFFSPGFSTTLFLLSSEFLFLSGSIMRNRCNVFNVSNAHSVSRQASDGRFGAGSRCSGSNSAKSAYLNVDDADSAFLGFVRDVFGHFHGGIRRAFLVLGFGRHSTG